MGSSTPWSRGSIWRSAQRADQFRQVVSAEAQVVERRPDWVTSSARLRSVRKALRYVMGRSARVLPVGK